MTGQPSTTDTTRTAILRGPRSDCVDRNVSRWYCHRGHDGAADGVCPLAKCVKQGANTEPSR